MLAKFTKPTLDPAPYKTIWAFKHSDGSSEYYIQMSQDESKPLWERLGLILEKTFEWHIVNDPSFIDDALRLIDLRIIKIEESEN